MIFSLARRGDTAHMLHLLRQHYNDREESTGKTLLHVVSRPDEMNALVDAGADVNARDTYGDTPLHLTESRLCFEILLRAGADVNARNVYGQTPLFCSVVNATCDRWKLSYMLKSGADVNLADGMGDTPLHHALNPMTCYALLGAGANVHARNKQMQTPLHTVYNHVSLKLMLIEGADPNAIDMIGESPLHGSDLDNTHVLVKHGAYVDTKDYSGKTAYNYAVESGLVEVAQYLFECGCDVTGGLNPHLFLHFLTILQT